MAICTEKISSIRDEKFPYKNFLIRHISPEHCMNLVHMYNKKPED